MHSKRNMIYDDIDDFYDDNDKQNQVVISKCINEDTKDDNVIDVDIDGCEYYDDDDDDADENELNRKFDKKYNNTISNKARYVYTVNDSVELLMDRRQKQKLVLDKIREKQDVLKKKIEKVQFKIENDLAKKNQSINNNNKTEKFANAIRTKRIIQNEKLLNALKHKLSVLNKEYELLSKCNKNDNTSTFLNTIKPSSNNFLGQCQLTNGYYFNKEPKSDEKLYYTEKDITQIIRTIILIHVFEIKIKETINDVVFNQDITILHTQSKPINTLNIQILIKVVDSLLGTGFCSIAKRPVMTVYAQYMNIWRYYDFGQAVALVSATDIINLYQFYNIANTKLCGATQFVIENSTDNAPTQSLIKHIL